MSVVKEYGKERTVSRRETKNECFVWAVSEVPDREVKSLRMTTYHAASIALTVMMCPRIGRRKEWMSDKKQREGQNRQRSCT
jgi:hypothetical protein